MMLRPLRVRACLLIALVVCAGCPRSGPPPTSSETSPQTRVEQSLGRAARFLLDRQSADGAWRSDRYGQFQDGTALTPLVLEALLSLAPSSERDAALRKGVLFLEGLVRADGTINAGEFGLAYPVYTSAGTVGVLSCWERDRHHATRDRWLASLRGRQLNEQLGWAPSDPQYGGWGYCPVIPRKPKPNELTPPLLESNLSATVFALSALREAAVPADDPAFQQARVFVERCQNFANDHPDPAVDDGGFFFIQDDPVRNKAGAAGRDVTGRQRFHSYGSTTADGLRALLLCGLPADHVRVTQARAWLTAHFPADRDPGRAAVFFYFHRSASRAFDALGIQDIDGPEGNVRWRDAMTEELLGRQLEDGSWANRVLLVREDEPLVATSFAVLALGSRP
jgi:Prenyltransferase and squalene oxidase repeat